MFPQLIATLAALFVAKRKRPVTWLTSMLKFCSRRRTVQPQLHRTTG